MAKAGPVRSGPTEDSLPAGRNIFFFKLTKRLFVFTHIEDYFGARICITLLYFAKIHHNALAIFF
jgi:hypothetical protein